jgi:hypothetical protein
MALLLLCCSSLQGLNSMPIQVPTLPAALQGGPTDLSTDTLTLSNTTSLPDSPGKHRKMLQNPATGPPTGAVTADKDTATSAVTAATTAAGADKNTLLPIKVSVQSGGMVPLKAICGDIVRGVCSSGQNAAWKCCNGSEAVCAIIGNGAAPVSRSVEVPCP